MAAHGAACGFAAAGAAPGLPDSIRANEVGTAIRFNGAPGPLSTCALVVLVPFAFSRTKPLSFSPNFTSTAAPPVLVTLNDLVTAPVGSFRLPVMLPGVTANWPACSVKSAVVVQSASTGTVAVELT